MLLLMQRVPTWLLSMAPSSFSFDPTMKLWMEA